MIGGLFGASGAQSTISGGNIAAAQAQNMLMTSNNVSQEAYNRAFMGHAIEKSIDVRIFKVQNGFVLTVDDKRYIADSIEEATGIITVQMMAMESK